jgi:hypothetical protein
MTRTVTLIALVLAGCATSNTVMKNPRTDQIRSASDPHSEKYEPLRTAPKRWNAMAEFG